MAQLSILGAQRIKALSEMLEVKYKEELKVLQTELSSTVIKSRADESFNLTELREKANDLKDELQMVIDEINLVTGERVSISYSHYSSNSSTPYQQKVRELSKELTRKTNELRASYDDKKNRLWLCETLEEAKQIVGI